MHRSLAALATAVLVALLAAGWAAAGDPLARARHAWDTFKSPSGYGANSSTGSRLTGGLGSNRYDFYRVALDEFAVHPVGGIGADNYAEQYLAHGRSDETPRYPHSVELRTLAETGIAGALLALLGLGAALVACWRALARSPDLLARAVAAAAAAGFVYWVRPRLVRLVLGVRGPGGVSVRAARPRLRAGAPVSKGTSRCQPHSRTALPAGAARGRTARPRCDSVPDGALAEQAAGPERGRHLAAGTPARVRSASRTRRG